MADKDVKINFETTKSGKGAEDAQKGVDELTKAIDEQNKRVAEREKKHEEADKNREKRRADAEAGSMLEIELMGKLREAVEKYNEALSVDGNFDVSKSIDGIEKIKDEMVSAQELIVEGFGEGSLTAYEYELRLEQVLEETNKIITSTEHYGETLQEAADKVKKGLKVVHVEAKKTTKETDEAGRSLKKIEALEVAKALKNIATDANRAGKGLSGLGADGKTSAEGLLDAAEAVGDLAGSISAGFAAGGPMGAGIAATTAAISFFNEEAKKGMINVSGLVDKLGDSFNDLPDVTTIADSFDEFTESIKKQNTALEQNTTDLEDNIRAKQKLQTLALEAFKNQAKLDKLEVDRKVRKDVISAEEGERLKAEIDLGVKKTGDSNKISILNDELKLLKDREESLEKNSKNEDAELSRAEKFKENAKEQKRITESQLSGVKGVIDKSRKNLGAIDFNKGSALASGEAEVLAESMQQAKIDLDEANKGEASHVIAAAVQNIIDIGSEAREMLANMTVGEKNSVSGSIAIGVLENAIKAGYAATDLVNAVKVKEHLEGKIKEITVGESAADKVIADSEGDKSEINRKLKKTRGRIKTTSEVISRTKSIQGQENEIITQEGVVTAEKNRIARAEKAKREENKKGGKSKDNMKGARDLVKNIISDDVIKQGEEMKLLEGLATLRRSNNTKDVAMMGVVMKMVADNKALTKKIKALKLNQP